MSARISCLVQEELHGLLQVRRAWLWHGSFMYARLTVMAGFNRNVYARATQKKNQERENIIFKKN
jgi:hypothetical protein